MSAASSMVGRESERRQVESLVEALAAGRGGLLLISGEAGIGKSALAGELTASARERGLLLLSGTCYDLTTATPYGPWLEIASVYPKDDALPRLPNELRPGTGVGQLDSQPALFALVRDFFTEIASVRPFIIVLEDLHWADQVSFDLLRYLVRQLQPHPVLFVATYRDDELTRDHPLSAMLPHLVREGRAARIWLQRLDEPALREMVRFRYRMGERDESRLAGKLFELTSGNPMFASELLRALEEQRIVTSSGTGSSLGDLDAIQVPSLIVQLIESRLYQLDDGDRHMLEMAAVIGQEVPLELWQALSGADDEALAAAIERAVGLHLMSEAPGGQRLAFTHGLVREAIYRGTLIVRRIAWHRRTAELLAAQPRPVSAVVAFHYQLAGSSEAAEWHARAGDRARLVYAPDTAVQHYTAALDLAREHGLNLPLDVTYNRGLAHVTLGNSDLARHDFESVLHAAQSASDQRMVWQVLTQLGSLSSERDYARTGDYLRQALEIARQSGDPEMLATSLNRFGNWHLNAQEMDRALELYGEALAIFQSLQDEPGQAASHDLLAMGHALRGDVMRAEEAGRAALALYRRLGDRPGEAQALTHLTLCAQLAIHDPLVPGAASIDEAVDAGERAVAIARDVRWPAGEVYCQAMVAGLYVGIGRIDDALERASAGLALAEEISHRQWQALCCHMLHRAWYALHHPERARSYAERELRIGQEISSMIWTYRGSADLAANLIAIGELDKAGWILDAARPAESPIASAEQSHLAMTRAMLLLARGEPEAALVMLDRITDEIPRWVQGRTSPRLAYVRGRTLSALGRHDEALAELWAAAEIAAARRARMLQWRIDLALERALAAGGNAPAAEERGASAESLVNEIAAKIEDEQLRGAFIRRALELRAAGPQPAPPAASSPLAGLSPRQIEVLRLVARGLTDAEVAEQLSISPRTVGGHLQAIFTRLGVGSRVEAARVALENGIV